MADREKVLWWTPNGWERGPVPVPHAAMEADPEGYEIDYTKLLGRHGYVARSIEASEEGEFAHLNYQVRVNDFGGKELLDRPRYLLVEAEVEQDVMSMFFVASEHEDLFWLEKWPALIEICNRVDVLTDMRTYVKAFLAFVRHGHGVTTISESGSETKEEAERAWELFRKEEKRKAAAAKAREIADL